MLCGFEGNGDGGIIVSLDLITIEVINEILGSHVFATVPKVGTKLVAKHVISVKVRDIS